MMNKYSGGHIVKSDKSEQYPNNFVEQYFCASAKLKKFERIVFKRFAPNVNDVKNDFHRLSRKFAEFGIYQYAAMCHIGRAKCEHLIGTAQQEANAYLCAARDFMKAHVEHAKLSMRSVRNEFRQGALHCYKNAMDRAEDGSVIKAAIIREMRTLHEYVDIATSSFASPTHRIHDLEIAAEGSIRREDFITSMRQLDDIVDNIYERKMQFNYSELLRSVEVLRILLLVQLNLPPARHSPAHIKLIEHYYQLANFELHDYNSKNDIKTKGSKEVGAAGAATVAASAASTNSNVVNVNNKATPGAFIPVQQQYSLAEIIYAWSKQRIGDLKYYLKDFGAEFTSISNTERHLLKNIYADLCRSHY